MLYCCHRSTCRIRIDAQDDRRQHASHASESDAYAARQHRLDLHRRSKKKTIIKVDTELVNLNVRVVDRNNRPINNLQEGEFKIYEDNVPQQIEFFSKSEVPTNYSLVVDNSGSLRSADRQGDRGRQDTRRTPTSRTTKRSSSGSSARDKIEIVEDFHSEQDRPQRRSGTRSTSKAARPRSSTRYISRLEKVTKYEKSRNSTDRKRRALILVSDGEDRNSYYTKSSFRSSPGVGRPDLCRRVREGS